MLFADDLVGFLDTESGLQPALNIFAAACDNAGMKIALPELRYLIFLEILNIVCCS